MAFLDDLKAFLMAHNIGSADSITLDRMPDQPDECIGLFLYAHAPRSGARRVHVQVRRFDAAAAYSAAYDIFNLLDSGTKETKINFTPDRWCIARPTAGPKKLTEDTRGRFVYYTEIALKSDDKP